MMRFLQSMDLYKGIILASLILTPGAGFWAWTLRKEIDRGIEALNSARKPGGEVSQIGNLEAQVENQRLLNKKMGDTSGDPRDFFVSWILKSVSGLRRDDFVLGAFQKLRGREKEGTEDTSVDIEFRLNGKDKVLQRDAIWAILLNLEQGSRTWKLRELKLRNKDVVDARGKAPAPEIGDAWSVDKMVFAVREPIKR